MLFGETGEIFYSLYQYSEGEFFLEYNRDKEIKEIIEKDMGILFQPQKIDINLIKAIEKTLIELQQQGYNVQQKFIGIEYSNDKQSYLTAEDCNILKAFEVFLKDKFNADLVISSVEDIYNIDDIINVNAKLDSEIEYINSLTVSSENDRPLNDMEKFILVYDFCTNFKYQENNENRFLSRNLTSILTSTNIVCVGYAELMKEMCTRLGIECYTQSLVVYDKKTKNERSGHRNNVVILDGKMYYADACWDCQRPESKGLKFYNHCLLPMEDKENFRKVEVQYYNNALGNFKEYKKNIIEYIDELKISNKVNDEIKEFISSNYNILKDIKFDEFPTVENFFTLEREINYEEYGDWQDRIVTEQKLKYLLDYYNKYEYGEPISYDTFEQSLMNIYLAKGMSEKSAQSLLDRTMEINEKRAMKCFNENAANCFVAGRTQELEI